METKRQLDVLDRRLAENAFVAGPDYTIADMANWPWYGQIAQGELYEAGEFLQVREYRHVQRWTEQTGRPPRRAARAHGQPDDGRSRQPAPRAQ